MRNPLFEIPGQSIPGKWVPGKETKARNRHPLSFPVRLTFVGVIALLIAACSALPTLDTRTSSNDTGSVRTSARNQLLTTLLQNTTWPVGRLASSTAAYDFCVVDEVDSRDNFERLASTAINSHSINLSYSVSGAGINQKKCHIVFFENLTQAETAKLLNELHAKPVLTIGTDEAFLAAGGMVALLPTEAPDYEADTHGDNPFESASNTVKVVSHNQAAVDASGIGFEAALAAVNSLVSDGPDAIASLNRTPMSDDCIDFSAEGFRPLVTNYCSRPISDIRVCRADAGLSNCRNAWQKIGRLEPRESKRVKNDFEPVGSLFFFACYAPLTLEENGDGNFSCNL